MGLWWFVAAFLLAALPQEGSGAGETSSTSEYEMSDTPALMEKFCGLDFGQADEPMAIDCSCCVTDGVGEYAQQAGDLYGSKRAEVDVSNEDGKTGKVAAWSLGAHVPEVVCVNGQAMCSCSAKDKSWMSYEPTCTVSVKPCRHDPAPKEWPTVCAEGTSCPERDKALGRSAGKTHKGDGPDAKAASAENSKQDSNDCAALPAWYRDSEKPKFSTRVSLGSSRCEDASPQQCHLFYAKVNGSWHHCEATTNQVKQCPARAVTEEILGKSAEELEAWAVKHAYSPGAWPVKILGDGTIQAVKSPAREEFLPHAGNLPRRIDATYKL